MVSVGAVRRVRRVGMVCALWCGVWWCVMGCMEPITARGFETKLSGLFLVKRGKGAQTPCTGVRFFLWAGNVWHAKRLRAWWGYESIASGGLREHAPIDETARNAAEWWSTVMVDGSRRKAWGQIRRVTVDVACHGHCTS